MLSEQLYYSAVVNGFGILKGSIMKCVPNVELVLSLKQLIMNLVPGLGT